MYHEWADKVNAEGKGVVHLDMRDGFALVNSANFSDQQTNDVVQISFGSPTYLGGQFPLAQVMALPFIFDTSEEPPAISKAKFQNLPPTVQKVLTDNSGESASRRLGHRSTRCRTRSPNV